jgi:hypothetical protein
VSRPGHLQAPCLVLYPSSLGNHFCQSCMRVYPLQLDSLRLLWPCTIPRTMVCATLWPKLCPKSKNRPNRIFFFLSFFSFLLGTPGSRIAAKLFWGPTLFPSAYHTASVTGQSPSWMYQAPVYLLSGLTAEMISGVIWTPMDVAKSRLQRGAEDPSTGRSAVRLLRGVWKREGWRGIFRVSGHS